MDYSKFSDQDLIHQFLSGRDYILNEIIRRHQSKVFGYILVSVKDKEVAEDIFQDTFVKVVKKLKEGSYNEEGKFIQWVLRISHNLIIDYFRRNSRVKMVRSTEEYDVFNHIPLFDKNIEDEWVKEQTYIKLHQLIEMLPESQREVLKMRHFCEMSFKDISEETGVSINTALGRMRYALINLRKIMDERNISLAM